MSCILSELIFFFFFSSRRRHTRWNCDWSSDVCSSDLEAAARMVLSGEATATPKRRDGAVESIRVLQIARRSGIKARTQAGQQIRSLVVTAPAELNSALAGLTVKRQVERCARLRPAARDDGAAASTRRALRSLA